MQLFLMRHGIAEDISSGGDSGRALTNEGKKITRGVVQSLKKTIGELNVIASSPYLRAQQTAEIVKEFFPDAKMMKTELVVPGGNPEDFLNWSILKVRGVSAILVASHEPYLGSLAGLLMCGRVGPLLAFDKAAIACFEWSGPGTPAQLLWFCGPEQLK